MNNKMEFPTLLHMLGWNHIVPRIQNHTELDSTELDFETRHRIIARDIFVEHVDLENSIALVRNWEMKLFVPLRCKSILDNARLTPVIETGNLNSTIRVRLGKIHGGNISCLHDSEMELDLGHRQE
jgi:hypothetical protein